MKKQANRRDFISDSSSSDDESLPELGSLRDRLARKRQFSALSSCASSTTEPVLQESEPGTSYTEEIRKPDSESYSCTYTAPSTDTNYTDNFSDSSGDEAEKLSLSQIIGNSVETEEVDTEPNTEKSADIVKPPGIGKSMDVGKPEQVKAKKKRTAEEIEESKRKAQEKREEREKQKAAKEAEKQMRKVERESKKQFAVGSCLKYIKVLIDTHVVNTCGLGVVLFKACEELGVTCETKELPLPFTIMWRRQVTECNMSADMKVETVHSDIEEQEMMAVIPVTDFVHMVNTFKLKQRGQLNEGITVRGYVNQMKSCLPDKSITIIVPGLEQYFRDVKSKTQRQYREAVQSANPNHKSKPGKDKPGLVTVSRVDVEEAVTDTLLQTGCSTFMLETSEDVADMVRRFSKAVAERPAKKDRFDPIFSFHEEGVGGVKVDKNGVGLLKVWKQQLLQFKNISPDISQAIIAEYPSPLLLRKAYQRCSSEKEAIKLLENIVVRRGAGVLETTRRVGKELSRRIYTFFTSEDPGLIIK
ncbi:crossover junction endonuclease EME1-like [Mercenaria mercenaria]|uniref:crossover junction endonuclease EME1-like n=1 Tax=Mercenaria mercenaria TaxID=6596 RepID=UPI00234E7B74|nr:crossover junction endonuclease EME1-like [Mercenaria mercenaria]XP_053392813.1 crossover junction endonuclease EME1-like [Mercenaria mercenaria]